MDVASDPPRFLGTVEVDSSMLLLGDPTYCLPHARRSKPGIDYESVVDAPLEAASYLEGPAGSSAEWIRRRRHVSGLRRTRRGWGGRAAHDRVRGIRGRRR